MQIRIKQHIILSKIGDIAKIGNYYYKQVEQDIWEITENQKYNF